MSGMWQLARDRKKYGPYPWDQLLRMAAAGQVLPTDMLLREGEQRWQTAREVAGLFAPAPPPAIPLPTAVPDLPTAAPIATNPELPIAALVTASPSLPAAAPVAAPAPAGPAPAGPAAVVSDKITGAFGSMFGKLKSSLASTKPASAPASGTDSASAAPRPPAAPETPPPPEGTVLGVEVCCQGGHPEFPDKGTGTLFLTKTGLTFRTTSAEQSWDLPFDRLVDVLEPRVGSWPEEMVKRAKNLQNAAQASRFAAGIAGSMMGGMEGAVLRTAGAAAAGVAGQNTKLGPPPHNRVILVLLHKGTKYAVRCDVLGKTAEVMEKSALEFRVKAMEFRPRFARQAAMGSRSPGTPPAVLPPGTFRAMIQGTVVGPLSADEVLVFLREGKLSPTDMIGVETWLPVVSLAPLLHSGSGMGGGAAGGASPVGLQAGAVSPPARSGVGKGAVVAAGVAGAAAGAVLGVAASRAFAGGSATASGNEDPGASASGKEGEVRLIDRDGDGRPDAAVMDRDGDGRIDAVGLDTDGDGRIDTIGLDEDQDGRVDVVGLDTDGDGDIDVVGLDADHDGELDTYGADLDDDGGMDIVGDMDDL